MGKESVSKDKETSVDKEKVYLAKCNDCEGTVRLSSTAKITPEQVDELQKRMLCSKCLLKKVKP